MRQIKFPRIFSFIRFAFPGLLLSICAQAGLCAAAGDVDLSFDAGSGLDRIVKTVVKQPDGKILIGGSFALVRGAVRHRIARLNADGSVDESFNPGSGANGDVTAIALLPDGKILAAGPFTAMNGADRHGVARLFSNGSLDTTFGDIGPVQGGISCLVVQSGGKIVIGGEYSMIHGVPPKSIPRLSTDGLLDKNIN
jgi:uncharacterized delta-60 repeat protein